MKNLIFVLLSISMFAVQAQDFSSLDEALQQPKSVKKLDLSDQSLILFPPEIIQLKKLQTLKLNHNPIQTLPEGICQLKKLQYLEIHGTAIEKLPACMAEMKKLKLVSAITEKELSYPASMTEKVFRPEEELLKIKPKPIDASIPPPPPPTKEKILNERLEISDAPKISQEENAPSPDVFIWVSQEPQPLNMGEIVNLIGYPEEAKERNIEGEVVARILVDKEGNYVQHKLVRKAHPILVNAVEAQIPKLKFSPAKRENEPIMFWVNIPLIFKL
jgi:TonB family protein